MEVEEEEDAPRTKKEALPPPARSTVTGPFPYRARAVMLVPVFLPYVDVHACASALRAGSILLHSKRTK